MREAEGKRIPAHCQASRSEAASSMLLQTNCKGSQAMGTKATSSKIEAAITRILEGKPVRIPADREFSIAGGCGRSGIIQFHHSQSLALSLRSGSAHWSKAVRKPRERSRNSLPSDSQRRLTQAQQVLRRRDDEIRRPRTVRLVLARELDALREELTHASHKDSDPAPGAQAGEHSG
ncbi:hypothetical protein ACU4GD_34320 [Cupriavidus basilensis]